MELAWRPDKQVTSGIAAEIMDGTIPAVVYNPFVWRMAEWRSGVSCFRRMTWGAVYTGQDTGPPHSLQMTHDLSRRSYESLSLAWTPGSVAPGHLPSDTHIYGHAYSYWMIHIVYIAHKPVIACLGRVTHMVHAGRVGVAWIQWLLDKPIAIYKTRFFSMFKTGSPHSRECCKLWAEDRYYEMKVWR